MSDGFIGVWFGDWTLQRQNALVTALAAAGLGLEEPLSGHVQHYDPLADLDALGEPEPMDRGEFLRRFALEDTSRLGVQFWFGAAGHDVFASFRRLDSDTHQVGVKFLLDGVYPEDADRLLGAIAALPDVKAVVVDRRGDSVEEDWDAVVLGGKVPDYPEFLARPGG